jgi:transcriptional regulator with XRE-family HTH domain|tara:strand:+ start:142 stop:351 length:210 start_codon:yes stop_codon:yes gene_type:complete
MKLSEWLKTNNISQHKMAEQLEMSPAAVSMICNQKRRPSLPILNKIEFLTNGQVKLEDFLDGEWQEKNT